MILELGIGVPLWNVVRFVLLSILTTTLISRVWSTGLAYRAGDRISAGVPVQLRPRAYTRSSLVAEEDIRDNTSRWLLLVVTVALVAADLLLEFGSGSTEVHSGMWYPTGYEGSGPGRAVEVVNRGSDRWEPTVYLSRKHSATYRIYFLEESNAARFNVTASDIDLLRSTGALNSSEFQLLDSPEPSEKVFTRRRGARLFAGVSGAVLIKPEVQVFWTGLRAFILENVKSPPEPSMAVLELVSIPSFRNALPAYAEAGMELIVELVAKPDLALTCDDGVDDAVEYPKTWAVTCTDEVGGPPRLKRHDRNLSPPDQSVLLTQQVEVNYGRRMVSFSELNDFSTATLVPSSSGRRRSVEQVLIGNKTYLVRLKTMSVSMVKDGPHSVICLRHDSGLGIAGEQTCRGRTWGSEDELVSAFMALQISAANYDTAWELFGSWSRGPEQGFTTKVQWISATLGDRSGRFAADTKSVATVNLYFFSGIALLALSLAAGAVVWFLSIQKSSREAVPVQMTIELSRRVLAMSAVTKYNCSMMPLDSPVTMIARRNDVSCHLETTHLDDMEPVSSSIMADEALVLLGGKNRTELTAPPDTSRKQLGRKGRFQIRSDAENHPGHRGNGSN